MKYFYFPVSYILNTGSMYENALVF